MADSIHGNEYRREWTLEILKLLIERRGHLNEVLKITRELDESMNRNDRVSVQMLLKMRAEELERIDGTIRTLQTFKMQLTEEAQEEIDLLLEGHAPADRLSETDKIIETVKNCRKILEDILFIDKRMSIRIAGKDSFYEK